MIEIRSLRVRFPGAGRDALEDLSLTLPDRGLVAVMGANGSGKSTLARALIALVAPTSGTISIDGLDVVNPLHVPEIRRNVGVVFQNPAWQMTSVTVERELAFGLESLGVDRDTMHAEVEAHLRRFGLEHHRAASPWTLSAGEQQRVAIASILILNPRYLVLDEVTSILSSPSRRQVMELAAAERSRRLVVLITQFAREALSADRLVVLHGGRSVADGPPRVVFGGAKALDAIGVQLPLEVVVGAPE